MTETMYKEELLDLYAKKPNYGRLKSKTHSASMKNLSCGDELKVEIEIKNNKIVDVKYTDKKGCFVTIISASVLTEKIKGMKVDEIFKITKKDIDKLLGLHVIETRIKCQLLPLEAIKTALK